MSSPFDPQAAFEQVTQRLDGLQASQNQMLQVLIQTVDIQTDMLTTQNRMLDTQNRMQETQNQMLATQNQMLTTQNQMLTTQNQILRDIKQLQSDVKQLNVSHLQLLKVQNQMLDYMKFTFDQQAKWNERQDQFNIIILDEFRELKSDVREIKRKVSGEIESRIIKLEDFMNDQLRKAS